MNMAFKTSELEKRNSLGKVLLQWSIRPKTAFKGLGIIVSILGVLIWFGIMKFDEFFPTIKKIPTYLIYLVPFIISPINNWLKKQGKMQEWTLYENGILFTLMDKDKVVQDKMWQWKNFRRADYYSDHVLLVPTIPFQIKLKVPSKNNAMSAYMICRERISIVSAKEKENKFKAPQPPDTREQRHIRKLENRVSNEHAKAQLNMQNKR